MGLLHRHNRKKKKGGEATEDTKAQEKLLSRIRNLDAAKGPRLDIP
jgi:hypothetical protein